MAQAPQSFANHVRFDPIFHFFISPVFIITAVISVVHLVRSPNLWSVWFVIVAIAALVAVVKMRLYALRVQDRVIRLEERLRLLGLVDESLRMQIPDLTERQLVALRFACDAEAAPLMRRALTENLSSKEIKQAIQTWRPDYWRV